MRHQRLHVIEQTCTDVHGAHGALRGQQLGGRQYRRARGQQLVALARQKQRALGLAVGIAQRDAHQEPIEL